MSLSSFSKSVKSFLQATMDFKRHFDKPFKLYHLSDKNFDGAVFEPRPMGKNRAMDGEDWKSPRICVSSSIDGALVSIGDSIGMPYGKKLWVHVPTNLEELFAKNKVHRPSTWQVPDAEVTGEHWLKASATMKVIGQIEIDDLDETSEMHYIWKGKDSVVYKFKWHWTIVKC